MPPIIHKYTLNLEAEADTYEDLLKGAIAQLEKIFRDEVMPVEIGYSGMSGVGYIHIHTREIDEHDVL